MDGECSVQNCLQYLSHKSLVEDVTSMI